MPFRVLGTLELVSGAHPSGPRGSDRGSPVLSRGLRRLLAALLVRADSVVAVDALADVVWGDELPVNVEAAMHNLVSRLRSALRAAAAPGPRRSAAEQVGTVLLTRAPGYLLQVAPGELDSARFERARDPGPGLPRGCARAGRGAARRGDRPVAGTGLRGVRRRGLRRDPRRTP